MVKLTRFTSLLLILLFSVALPQAQTTDVLTQHNDYNRTGWNNTESILNTSNVTPTNFGLLYKRSVDDQIYTQPLVVTGLSVTDPTTHQTVTRNVVFIATVNDKVYAFDADDGSLNPYWTKDFLPSGKVVPNALDIHANLCGFAYTDFQGNTNLGQNGKFGIVGTPVIDRSTNTLYLVSRYREPNVDNTPVNTDGHTDDPDWDNAGFYEQFHALDLSTGAEKFNGPVLIDPATTMVPGTGPGHDINNMVHFDARRNNQRGGLLISNGIVYIPFAGHCDMDNYHGWILGYKVDDLTKQLVRYATTPNDERGGIWMAGAGPALDANGNLFFATGNANDASLANSPDNVGLSVIKASPDLANGTLHNESWFKPLSYHDYNTSDLDFGTGIVLIPGQNLLVTAHKTGKLLLMKKDAPAPGEYNEGNTNFLLGSYDLGAGNSAQGHSSISYFGGTTRQYIYQFSEYTHVMAFPVNTGSQTLGSPVLNTSVPENVGLEGGYTSVSSNGGDPATGILWVTHYTGPNGGTLHALKADDITQELWNSDQNSGDALGHYSKMSPVTIANGKVYAPTFSNSFNVYGLLASNSRCVTNVALNKPVHASTNTDEANTPESNATDGNLFSRWGAGGSPTYIYVDLQSRYDICKIDIHWNNVNDYPKNFNIDVTDDTLAGWTTVNQITNNVFPTQGPFFNSYNEHVTARYVRMSVQPGSGFFTSLTELQIYGNPANNCIAPSVTTMSVTNITQNTATLNFQPVTGVTDYVVRYKGPTVSSYITRLVHDASNSGNTLSVNVGALTCGFTYEFDVQSDCGSGSLSAPSVILATTAACTGAPCLSLTRFYHGDLGDIAIAGSSCYNDPAFTVTGSGNGLSGSGDQFQFNYTDLNKDEDFSMHIASQSAIPASNLAGIMMRDSVTDISRYVFIGKSGDNNLYFIYRSTVGGMATVMTAPNALNATYFKITKAGTTYTAYYGITPAGPWNQMGPTAVDLGFGSQTIKIGMAVSSLSTITTSTANFDNLSEGATALPVQLLNFTAANVQDEYVQLKWQTAMEENNDHFEIERSTDGINFIKIVSVKAIGNSSTLQSYSATDSRPARGLNFYRLKQVDVDSRYTYSPVRTIKFGSGIAPLVYPNPVSDIFTAVPGTELISEIVIYNVQGKAVQFVMGNSTDAEMKVNISRLATGVYFLKIKTNSKVYQYKLIKE